MKAIKNHKGLTLVETIVSLAIFGIVSVGLLSIFTESLLITSRAGDRSESVMKVSTEIEKKLYNQDYSNNLILSEQTSHHAIIYYNYDTVPEEVEINGSLIKGTEINERGQEIEIKAFIPKVVSP